MKKDNEHQLNIDELPIDELVRVAGRSGLRIDRLSLVIQSRYPNSYTDTLLRLKPGGDLHSIYVAAVAEGNADILVNLHSAITPSNAEAYKTYQQAVRDVAVSDVIEKNFGIK